ncbi:tripartite tricarboxylate transporter substrate binding protein [Ruegeria sp.]|uniref:Bug family tripartite tricarboxylate transporter substrate binding protein n=1 Tax=Ruegeria sp. TaxID=1879320 RepID=UPI00230BCF79|nr:tripartite tricarboxylate transporter substrate binding protein [Ruegeria sp.]MDA7966026.1 tripartite tricarboxylate transporter substrate binding protein [Ruegeria sp.]
MNAKKLFSAVAAVAVLAAPQMSLADAPECTTAKLIVPWSPGGGTHIIFSLFEKAVNKQDPATKIQVVAIPGQGGNKGAREALKADADGCTLFAIHESALISYLNKRVDFNWDAFEPVSLLTSTPDILGARGGVEWADYGAMSTAVEAAPETITVGATFGSTSHFVWLRLEEATGLKFKYVPFDGTRQRMTALLANTIDMGAMNVTSGREYFASGELRGLAIAAEERSPHLPDIPTLKELGVDMVSAINRGVVAPKGTPETAITYWAEIFEAAANDPELVQELNAKGTDVDYHGPQGYGEWFGETFEAYKAVADKIGMGS